ncbi:hypothetical protein F5148DRAFT_998459 [Russula earlei]|uniref:Uncharacterized protein n=2 Tax=Russula earlei TaxID=71964 RepID=A0ACC0TSN8_9AGAM|nr:hypothetical protein F5148DRAFT_1380453 [Russula earlei]KAI9508155.1 hypothetical protein F5148DRAFT_998459 [Russula earlei]
MTKAAIEEACESLQRMFQPGDSVDKIQKNLRLAWAVIHDVLDAAEDVKMKGRVRNSEEFNVYIKSEDKRESLIRLVQKMAKNELDWEDLFKNEAFLKPEPTPDPDPFRAATERAWSGQFKGDLANVLLKTIADYLCRQWDSYARLTTIINSSGTGKSRIVDQLGKEVITVPMCLRKGYEGYPPPDVELRNWLLAWSSDRATVQRKLYGFARSLLVVTLSKLETIGSEHPDIAKFSEALSRKSFKEKSKDSVPLIIDRHKRLASAFRQCMTMGQSYRGTNVYRGSFYDDVIKMATEFAENSENVGDKVELGRGRGRSVSARSDWREGLHEAGENLCRFIDEYKVLDFKEGPRRPLVVLAFDEAHVLLDNPHEQKGWNLFSELHHILRQIDDFPIFSVFISTSGRFHFSREIRSDPSAWTRESNNPPLTLFSEISFDDVAYPALKDTVTIHKVVKIDWISHLGRPLFGSYWDYSEYRNEVGIMDYAKQKLLCGPTVLEDNPNGLLACLSVRFALAFNMDVSARDVNHVQVERHMRLRIAATVGLENLVTMAGSEPLLAEAAYDLMEETRMNAVCHLANHPNLNCIDRGRRGELVAALLIMQAFDVARAINRKRWVTVVDFMKALLPESNYEALLRSLPTSWPENHKKQMTFEEIFKDYGLWFNHVIKIECKEMISTRHLWKFVTRGAMILCGTNQDGIDIVLPAFLTTRELGPNSMTVVVIQVKNANAYGPNLDESLFDAMDSVVKSAILSTSPVDSSLDSDCEFTIQVSNTNKRKPTKPVGPSQPKKMKENVIPAPKVVNPELATEDMKPVIRVVFALASPTSAVAFRKRPPTKNDFDGFTAFDIWLAGLDRGTFNQIQEVDKKSYKLLLERSLMPHDGFTLKDEPDIGEKAKKAREPRRRRMAPLMLPDCGHHGIHL